VENKTCVPKDRGVVCEFIRPMVVTFRHETVRDAQALKNRLPTPREGPPIFYRCSWVTPARLRPDIIDAIMETFNRELSENLGISRQETETTRKKRRRTIQS
jgi:hypothetical protein